MIQKEQERDYLHYDIYFNGNDEDSAYIGECFGGEHLTEDIILDTDYYKDYAIQ